MQKEDSLQKVSVEVERVKGLLQSKAKECQQKLELGQTLEATLSKTECELAGVKRSFDSERQRLEAEVRFSASELDKAKDLTLQLSDNVSACFLTIQFRGCLSFRRAF